MSKHTPGPWVVSRDSGLNIYITQPSELPGRRPGYYAEVRRFTPDTEQVEANARLIAAAPEMLEALEMVRAALDPDNLRGDSEEVWCNWVNVMSAMFLAVMVAIKKARGEE